MPPGFPCAELLPCDVLHALYGSAAQDLMGYLKQSHMEYQKLFTVQTATLRLKTVTLVIDHISVLPFIFTVYSLRGVVVSTCLRARGSWGPSPVTTGLSVEPPGAPGSPTIKSKQVRLINSGGAAKTAAAPVEPPSLEISFYNLVQ